MTIALDAYSTGYTQYGIPITQSHTVGAGTNRALFVGVYANASSDIVTGVTYGDVAMTRVLANAGQGIGASIYWYVLIAPTVGTDDIVVSFGGNGAFIVHAASFTGVHQTTATAATAQYVSAGTSAEPSLAIAVASGGAALDIIGGTVGALAFTPASGQTLITQSDNGASPTAKAAISMRTDATAMQWTQADTYSTIAHGAIALNPAAVAATVPGAPTIGAASVSSATSVSVNGTAPANNGGSPITGYTATSTPGSITGTSATLPVPVPGLMTGQAYTFTLHATNSVGPGAESAASNSVTPAAGNPVPTFGGTIANLTGTNGVAITPVDVHANFSDSDALVYSASPAGTAWPSGLVINSSTGIISGTVATSTTAGLKVRATDTASQTVDSNAFSATISAAAPATFTDKLRFSPYNWNVTSTQAKSVNPGAYFSTLFSGASCTLTFDLTGETAYPSGFWYRIDQNGPWRFTDVQASVVLDMTGADTAYAAGGGHLLEVVYRYIDGSATNRWSPQQCALVLTGITLASGGALTLPPTVKARNVLFFGDSITEGVLTHSGSYSQDAMASWAFLTSQALGAEFGIVGFAGQGWIATGTPAVPIFGSTWNSIYSGVSRSLSPEPAMIVINQGTNDLSGNATTAATAVLNAMLAATTDTKIVVMRPFSGTQAANLQAAVTAVANARCTYLDTTGWYDQAANGNRLHPYANVTATDIAPRAINALTAVLANTAPPPAAGPLVTWAPLGKQKNIEGVPAVGVAVHAFINDKTTGALVTTKTGLVTGSDGAVAPFTTNYATAGVSYEVKIVDDANPARRSIEIVTPT